MNSQLTSGRFPRSNKYSPDWIIAGCSGGANPIWLTEWLTNSLDLRSGMRILDLGCGRALSSIFLRREFEVEVWAVDLWFSASENLQRIHDAGVERGVHPMRADARSLPFANNFFDAIISIDSFPYYGTDDLYLGYVLRFVKPGGQIAIAGAGLTREIEGRVPEPLIPWWEPSMHCLHSASWWRSHWEKTGLVNVDLADGMPEGWKLWVEWQKAVAPENVTEIRAIERDAGDLMGYVRAIARRRLDAKLEEIIQSVPTTYTRQSMLRRADGTIGRGTRRSIGLSPPRLRARSAPDRIRTTHGQPIVPSLTFQNLGARMIESAAPLDQATQPQIAASESAARAAGLHALRAAFFGFFVDMFDVYLPVIALGPAISYFQPSTLSPALQSTLYYVVFAVSLVGRPFGATLFGHYADRLGRRRVTIISMGGFSLVTLLIGLLPGYETLGATSIALLTFLRLVDGIFLGGEYTGANPLAMELAPKEKRGKWAAIIHTGFPVSLAAMSLITASLLRVFPAGSLHSPYVQWGWRIPFFVGALLAGGVFVYYLTRVPESNVWATAPKAASPLQELFSGGNFRSLLQVFLVMSGAWFTLNAVTSILPGVLLTVRHVSSVTVTNAQLIASVVLGLAFVPFGMLGQKIGRRNALALMGLAGCTAGPILYYVLVESGYKNSAELILLVTLVNLCALPTWAIVTSYINERFPTSCRASGYGIGYSAATIIPAFSSFYMLGLKAWGVPYENTQLVIFALGGVLLLVGALLGPETKHVDI